MINSPESWLAQLEDELLGNILSFWMKQTKDEINGGFVGEIDNQLNIVPDAKKSLVLNARILWSFASAYRIYGKTEYLAMAERAYAYLMDHFIDKEYGGLYWMVNAEGKPSQEKKQIYGQAFTIYALAEFYHATGRPEVLDEAIQIFQLVEKYGYDSTYKGYVEALSREWQITDNLSLSSKDLNEKNQ